MRYGHLVQFSNACTPGSNYKNFLGDSHMVPSCQRAEFYSLFEPFFTPNFRLLSLPPLSYLINFPYHTLHVIQKDKDKHNNIADGTTTMKTQDDQPTELNPRGLYGQGLRCTNPSQSRPSLPVLLRTGNILLRPLQDTLDGFLVDHLDDPSFLQMMSDGQLNFGAKAAPR
jgi:hypothetical protein